MALAIIICQQPASGTWTLRVQAGGNARSGPAAPEPSSMSKASLPALGRMAVFQFLRLNEV
jgi:hypothetical protein